MIANISATVISNKSVEGIPRKDICIVQMDMWVTLIKSPNLLPNLGACAI